MFAERIGEDGRARERRMQREAAEAEAAIKARDDSIAVTEAEKISLRQHQNIRQRIPFDYAAIMRGRQQRPELFMDLPSDAECRQALGLPELTEVERVQRLKARKEGSGVAQ